MQISQDLIKDCIKQKRTAHNFLYKELFSFLMSICIRYKCNYNEAGESLNAIFYKILTNLESFKEESRFQSWVKRIAINHLIDEYRKNKNAKEKLTYVSDDYLLNNNYNSFHQKEAEMESEYLLRMIRSLPIMTAKVFNLYAIDGLKHREIGELLEMSENTSKWHLRDARSKLKVMIEIYNETVLK